ncbi:hypothetical protein ACSTS3_21620 [Aquimarina muelleri]|uniref:hypothetical protein n=1 Tax=Aquimarina muelleri TaxID=279356 RepID=UPI003F687063
MQELQEIEAKIKKHKTKSILFSIGIMLFILVTFITPFIEVFFPVKSESVIKATKAYEEVNNFKIREEEKLRSLVYDYYANSISSQSFKSKINKCIPLIKDLQSKSEVLHSNLQEAKDKDRVFGFRTLKVFFANLGMPVVSVFLGFFLLILFNKEQDLFFRKVILAFSFVGTITGLFYVVWVFYPQGDLPETTYVIMQLSFAIFGALVAFIVGKYFFALSQINLKIKIQDLLSFITNDIKRKYISKHDRQEFISDYLGEIEKLSKK